MKPISILFEDDYYIAVDKPSGVLSIPPRAGLEEDIFSFFKAKYDDLRLVHRIDKETSGVLIKEYKAILAGIPKEDSGTIENYLDEHPNVKGTYRLAYQGKGKLAISHYQIEEKFKRNCLVAFQIETGRTHQIRVHAQFLGCPLGYDPIYNPQNGIFLSRLIKNYKGKDEERSIIQRLSLHAQTLRFYHPFTGEVVDIQSLFPRDFQKAIEILRKHC
jgi:23S rRNA pseudouridine1911/1915/1917 synthase